MDARSDIDELLEKRLTLGDTKIVRSFGTHQRAVFLLIIRHNAFAFLGQRPRGSSYAMGERLPAYVFYCLH
jgi:hypothetical protein